LGPGVAGKPVWGVLPLEGDSAAHARPRIRPDHQHLLIIGESGNIGQANYAAAKSGLFGLTMSLAQETARRGITVNDVAPGYISTDMVAAVPQEALDKVIAKIPVGRLGEPEEIARTVEFLADPDSSFITGQIFSVNGGQYM
jgi:acetoacetyl-CoA reductase